jgi:hypothetical protein
VVWLFSSEAESGGTSFTSPGNSSVNLQSRPSKTVATNAEQQRRRELETGFHNLKEVRQQRIRRLNDIVDEYLVGVHADG